MGDSTRHASTPRPHHRVLLAEDSSGDVLLLREAFRARAPSVVLESVPDGLSALRRLGGEGEYARAPEPDLLILDLALPRLDGRAVLSKLRTKAHPTPVIILSGSSRRVDRAECLKLGAISYAVKPMYFGEWLSLVDLIASYLKPLGSRGDNPSPKPVDRALA